MIIPVRCFTCNKVIGHLWDLYQSLLKKEYSEADALDAIKLNRVCCRTIMLRHVNIIDELIKYE